MTPDGWTHHFANFRISISCTPIASGASSGKPAGEHKAQVIYLLSEGFGLMF